MSSLLTPDNLGPEFDLGVLTPDKIRLKIGAGLAISPTGVVTSIPPVTVSQQVYVENLAGKTGATAAIFSRNATTTRTDVGRWEIRFNSPHPDGSDYHPSLTSEEGASTRDTPDVTVVEGTPNANGFDIQIVTGDNGGTADAYVDAPFSWGVSVPVTVVTQVN